MNRVCPSLTKKANKVLKGSTVCVNPQQGYILEYRLEGQQAIVPLGRTLKEAEKKLIWIKKRLPTNKA
ncbi:Uncharacterised protein [uncultured archaeon]|nr:Uncharacterised protein [uncultured archaeon]